MSWTEILETREKHKNAKTGGTADIYSFCQMFPFLLPLRIKRIRLCKWRLLRTNPLCDVNMSGQVWIEMPGIMSPLVLRSIMAVERDFRASGGTQSSARWGHNGLIKALEKRHFCTASINTTSCHPERCLRSLTLLAASDWRALLLMMATFDLLVTCLCNGGMWKRASVGGESLSISVRFELSRLKMFRVVM